MSEPVIIGNATLYQGDCLEILPTLSPLSTKALITDPPYMIGAVSVGNAGAKAGGWPDMENSSWWFSEWLKAGRRALKQDGFSCVFTNWRGLMTLQRAYSRVSWPTDSLMVWDKNWIGPAGPRQLRPIYELVLFAGMPEAKIDDRSAPDLFRCQWMAGNSKTTDHPAEKPVKLMEHLVGLTTGVGDIVVDCFMGSGTTGVASQNKGRAFVGIEADPRYFDIACERIENARREQMLDLGATA